MLHHGASPTELGRHQQGHTAESEADAEQADRPQRVTFTEQERDDRADDRHAGDQQPGQAGREVPLGVGEQEPRDGHLQGGEGQQRTPP